METQAPNDLVQDEVEGRRRVVEEAKTWIGTPFRDQADTKGPGGGVDCAMLLVRVHVDTKVLPPFDPRPYYSRFFLHKDDESYLDWVIQYGREIPEAEAKPGDIVVFFLGRAHAHGAIIVSDQLLVHAWFKEMSVSYTERWTTELNFERNGKPRKRKFFTMWPRKS